MKKIIRWFFGVLLLFGALASFALSFPAGICLFAAGLILLPPVSRRIPQFKGRKLVLSVGCVVLALMGIVYMSETESETVAERQEPPEATETETAETETAET